MYKYGEIVLVVQQTFIVGDWINWIQKCCPHTPNIPSIYKAHPVMLIRSRSTNTPKYRIAAKILTAFTCESSSVASSPVAKYGSLFWFPFAMPFNRPTPPSPAGIQRLGIPVWLRLCRRVIVCSRILQQEQKTVSPLIVTHEPATLRAQQDCSYVAAQVAPWFSWC